MSSDNIARVQFFDRQFLRPQDLTDEQAYHIAMRRRHNIAHHIWGIVSGLLVVVEESGPAVTPGMAVDGFGRELVLEQKTPLAVGAFVDKGSDVLDVWLVYDRLSSDQPPKGYAGCGNKGSAPFYRYQEQPRVRLERPDPAFPDRRSPKGVQPADLVVDSTRTPPDDPQRFWPVFLGQVTRNPADPNNPFTVDLSGRPYAGLVGESILAPSGLARVQVGAELAGDPNRFAVFIPAVSEDDQPAQPKMAIRRDGTVEVHGDATVSGDLAVTAGAVRFAKGSAQRARPWRIYRAETASEGLRNEMRIEMQGGTRGGNRVVIGVWSADEKKFKPCLTVTDECNVTVHGNLTVEGQARATSFLPGELTPEAKAFVAGSTMMGVGGGSTLLNRFYRRPGPVLTGEATSGVAIPDITMRAAVSQLQNTNAVERFAALAKQSLTQDQINLVIRKLQGA